MFSTKKYGFLLLLLASLHAGVDDIKFLDSCHQDQSILEVLPKVSNVVVTLPDKVDRTIDQNKINSNIEQAVAPSPKKRKFSWPKMLGCGVGIISIVLVGLRIVSAEDKQSIILKGKMDEIDILQNKILECVNEILGLRNEAVQEFLSEYQKYLKERIFTYQKRGALTPDSYCFCFNPDNQIVFKTYPQPKKMLQLFSYYTETDAGKACLTKEERVTSTRLQEFFLTGAGVVTCSGVKDIIYLKYVAATKPVDLGESRESKIDLFDELEAHADLFKVLEHIKNNLLDLARKDLQNQRAYEARMRECLNLAFV